MGGPNPKSHPFPPIAHESTTMTGLRHVTGTISLGRFAPGSATSNFFICGSPEPYLDAHLGGRGDNLGFAAFGQVIQGMAVVRKNPVAADKQYVRVRRTERRMAEAARTNSQRPKIRMRALAINGAAVSLRVVCPHRRTRPGS